MMGCLGYEDTGVHDSYHFVGIFSPTLKMDERGFYVFSADYLFEIK